MYFADIPITFNALAYYDDDTGLTLKTSTLLVHYVTPTEGSVNPELRRICGGMLKGVAPTLKWWSIAEAERDGELRTLAITFQGEEFSKALRAMLAERQTLLKDKPRRELKFQTTAEEALYHAFVTGEELQFDVYEQGSDERVRLALKLDYTVN
jgi:hypothetical protein